MKAVNDADFVAEVAQNVEEECTRMNSHVSCMIEEYLRRRVQQVREDLEGMHNIRTEELKSMLEDSVTQKSRVEENQKGTVLQLTKVLCTLAHSGERTRTAQLYHGWRSWTSQRRARRLIAEVQLSKVNALSVFRSFTQWRLYSAARRQVHERAKQLRVRDCREQELLGQIEIYQKQLAAERERCASLDEKLKEAFLRGMCALNREAVQALHGADDGGHEEDVEAIAEILTRDSQSHRASAVQASNESMQREVDGICPVHHLDHSGNFYHRCFAPDTCAYRSEQRSSPPPPPSSPPHAPFLVRADVRNASSGSVCVARPPSHILKDSKTRWRF